MGAPIINLNTTQRGMASQGNSGVQVTKFIPGARVYVKAADSVTAAPVQNYFTKSNGVVPAGWTDLGSVDGDVKVTYTKTIKEVQLGIDKVVRAAYIDERKFDLSFNLAQFDDVVIGQVLGLTPSIITAGSVVNYQLGQEVYGQQALLCVYQNKLDGKEWQLYHPAAYIDGTPDYSSDSLIFKCSAKLIYFTAQGATAETLASTTVLA